MARKASRAKALAALNKLTKWRVLLTGWQLGTRSNTDPEAAAVRDIREALLLMRVDTNVLVSLAISKGLFTQEEFYGESVHEAEELEQTLEQRFPGVRATDTGLSMDARAVETMKGWKP